MNIFTYSNFTDGLKREWVVFDHRRIWRKISPDGTSVREFDPDEKPSISNKDDDKVYLDEEHNEISYSNGQFYYVRSKNILSKINLENKVIECQKTLKHVSSLDVKSANYEISGIPRRWMEKVMRGDSNIVLGSVIYRQVRKGTHDWTKNVLTLDGYLLFDEWYDDVFMTEIRGLYFVKKDDHWSLVDSWGSPISRCDFTPIDSFIGGYAVVKTNNGFGLMTADGEITEDDFSSVLRIGLGYLEYQNDDTEKTFWYSPGGMMEYAHEFLRYYQLGCLLEKNNTWYYINKDGHFQSLFVYEFKVD